MGAVLGRQTRRDDDEDSTASSQAYRYPVKFGGNYFGANFLMGGEKFETGEPESYLFGDNNDLNFIGPRPNKISIEGMTTSGEPESPLQALVHVRKDSVRFVQATTTHAGIPVVGGAVLTRKHRKAASMSATASLQQQNGEAARASRRERSVSLEGQKSPHDKPQQRPRTADAALAELNNNNNQKTTSSAERPLFHVQCVIDCDVPCVVRVYYMAMEACSSSSGSVSIRTSRCCKSTSTAAYRFPAGSGHVFTAVDHSFDPGSFTNQQLQLSDGDSVIPVLIECAVDVAAMAKSADIPEFRQTHLTLCQVDRSADRAKAGYALKALRQKLLMGDGMAVILQEIYGIENKAAESRRPSLSSSDDEQHQHHHSPSSLGGIDTLSECVVCMSELRDTLILPCRHLCLCHACGENLRYKVANCPVCRAPFKALLQLKAFRRSGAGQSAVRHCAASPSDGEGACADAHELEMVPMHHQRFESTSLLLTLNGGAAAASNNSARTDAVPHTLIPLVQHSSAAGKSPPPAQSSRPSAGGLANSALNRLRGGSTPNKNKNQSVSPIQEVLTPDSFKKSPHSPTGASQAVSVMVCQPSGSDRAVSTVIRCETSPRSEAASTLNGRAANNGGGGEVAENGDDVSVEMERF